MESENSVLIKLSVIGKHDGREIKEFEGESCYIDINSQSCDIKQIAEILRLIRGKLSLLINNCLEETIKTENANHFTQNSNLRRNYKSAPQERLPNSLVAPIGKQTEELKESINCKAISGTTPLTKHYPSSDEENEDVLCDAIPCDEDKDNKDIQLIEETVKCDKSETKANNKSSNESSQETNTSVYQSYLQHIVDEFICEICEGKFTTKGTLKRHIKELHVTNNSKQFKCVKCLRKFQSLHSLTVHKETHVNQLSSGLFGCDTCHKQFVKRSSFLVHVRRSGGSCGQSTAICEDCGKCFSSEGAMNIHVKRYHTASNNNLSCQKCRQTFTTKNGLQKHKVKNSCLVDFACPKCRRVFKQANLLKAHQQTHMSQNYNQGYQCQKCFRRFATSRGFGYHKRHCSIPTCWVASRQTPQSNEEITKQYICEICGKHFSQNSSLHKHARKHSNVRPFRCPSCGKCFFDRFGLKVHERTHSGEKPYLCSQCGKSFISNSKLKRHMNTHSTQLTPKLMERTDEFKKQKRKTRTDLKKNIVDPHKESSMQNQINPRNELSDFPKEQTQKIHKQTLPNPEYTFEEPAVFNNYSNMDRVRENVLYYSDEVEMDGQHCLGNIHSGYSSVPTPFDSYHYPHPPPPYPSHQYQSDTQFSQPDSSRNDNDYVLLELNSNLQPYDINNV